MIGDRPLRAAGDVRPLAGRAQAGGQTCGGEGRMHRIPVGEGSTCTRLPCLRRKRRVG